MLAWETFYWMLDDIYSSLFTVSGRQMKTYRNEQIDRELTDKIYKITQVYICYWYV